DPRVELMEVLEHLAVLLELAAAVEAPELDRYRGLAARAGARSAFGGEPFGRTSGRRQGSLRRRLEPGAGIAAGGTRCGNEPRDRHDHQQPSHVVPPRLCPSSDRLIPQPFDPR